MRRCAVVLTLTLALLAACGGGPIAPSTAKTIGAAGGSFEHEGATLEVPAGALASEVELSIATMQTAIAPTNIVVVGTPVIYGPTGQQFAKPVTLTLGVNLSALPAGKTLADVVVFTAPAGTNEFEPLPTHGFDVARVSATTTHFSVFVPGIAKSTDGT